MQTLLILGRQPAIGLAELESLYGASNLRPVGNYAAIVDREVDFARIGGSIKATKLLRVFDTTHWPEIQKHLESSVPGFLLDLGKGKLRLGLSAYGFDVTAPKITATGLSLKKVIRLGGRSVRLVPNTESILNSAQVLYNKLTGALGCELLLVKDGNKTILAQTTAVQDIDAYARRDRGRPKRDARVGMLPPKLAQIIINLAAGQMNPKEDIYSLLDPFCGTGVIVLEALLMGFDVTGTDIDPRMTAYTSTNIDWLRDIYKDIDERPTGWGTQLADATSMTWQTSQAIRNKKGEITDAKLVPMKIDVVASEVYLGRPFSSLPAPAMLEKNRQDCDTIIRKFLKNIHGQTKAGTRLALALPAWFADNKIYHLTLLDSLGSLGYNRIQFVHASHEDLIYHREKQIVGRELVVLTRK